MEQTRGKKEHHHKSASGADSDRSLVVRVQQHGSRCCQAELFSRHCGRVEAIARHCGLRGDAVHDCSQNAWMIAMAQVHTLRDPGAFGPWLRKIARNEAITMLRRLGRETPTDPDDMPTSWQQNTHQDDSWCPEATYLRDTDIAMIQQALGQLSAADTELLKLLFVQELSYRGAADELRCGVGSIGPRRGRSLSRLRQAYLAAA